jgi:uncharacterized alkaline shock family protein YloU
MKEFDLKLSESELEALTVELDVIRDYESTIPEARMDVHKESIQYKLQKLLNKIRFPNKS